MAELQEGVSGKRGFGGGRMVGRGGEEMHVLRRGERQTVGEIKLMGASVDITYGGRNNREGTERRNRAREKDRLRRKRKKGRSVGVRYRNNARQ